MKTVLFLFYLSFLLVLSVIVQVPFDDKPGTSKITQDSTVENFGIEEEDSESDEDDENKNDEYESEDTD